MEFVVLVFFPCYIRSNEEDVKLLESLSLKEDSCAEVGRTRALHGVGPERSARWIAVARQGWRVPALFWFSQINDG